MAKGEYLGEFEQVVLLALARLQDRAYGMSIRQEIEQRTSRDVAIGSVYSALDRLERKGYITSKVGDPTPQRGGRAKRYYSMARPGLMALKRTLATVDSLLDGLELDVDLKGP